MAHRLLRERLRPGDLAVDATVGNGHDTEFLADCVGPSGRVIGFDVQPEAIEAARRKLDSHPWVTLHRCGHERLDERVSEPLHGVTFNLGYLPGGERAVITRPETTLTALTAAVELLADTGLITIVVYTGHDGGDAEAQAVETWAAELDGARFAAARYQFLNRRNSAPFLLVVERRTG